MNNKLGKGILVILIANIINVFFSLATNFLLPQYLSIDAYAGIKGYQLYASYIGLFHFGYVDGIYLKYGGKDLDRNLDEGFGVDLSTMYIFQAVITAVGMITAIAFGDYILFFCAMSILPQNMSAFFKFLYQATGEFDLYGRAMNLTTISTFVLNMVLMFLVRTDDSILYIFGYVILTYLIWAVLDIYFRSKHVMRNGIFFSIASCVSNVRSGFLLTLGNLSSIFLTSMDRWFVKALMDTVAFAQYSFAVSVENFLNLAITPVTTTLYNYFCRVDDKRDCRRMLECVVVFSVAIPAAAFPVKFILEVYLKKYLGSALVIFFLFASQMFYTVIRSVYVNLYKVQGRQKSYFLKLLVILVIGFALNCVCYAVVRAKESFAVGTLISAVIWYFISKSDFKDINSTKKTDLYLLLELIAFLTYGSTLSSIVGFVCYMITTLCLTYFLMKDALTIYLNYCDHIFKRLERAG